MAKTKMTHFFLVILEKEICICIHALFSFLALSADLLSHTERIGKKTRVCILQCERAYPCARHIHYIKNHHAQKSVYIYTSL